MGIFSASSILTLLEGQRELLDQVFGQGAYSIESYEPDVATVRSAPLEWRVSYDSRDRSIGSLIASSAVSWVGEATPQVWALFLGDEATGWPKESSGHISLSLDEQMRIELQLLARLNSEIFSDPQRARDAANFVQGYHKAYNDWASGNWG